MEKLEVATFGGGCFWCLEAIFSRISGIKSITSGYSGGNLSNPTYEQVCSGETGHAEVIQIKFDLKKIKYETLLDWFWISHDPTTLNRQGADIGSQYRSVIFYHNENQKNLALHSKKILQKKCLYNDPIVTEITRHEQFFQAEDYHQNYFKTNPESQYCSYVIKPKLEKLKLN